MNGIVVAIIVGVIVLAGAIGYFVYANMGSETSSSEQDFSALDESEGSKKSSGGSSNVQSSVEGVGDDEEPIEKDISDDEPVPERAPDEVWLIERRDARRDRVFNVDEFPARVGRHPYSAVQLSNRGISRIHFRIHREGLGFVIQPLKTKNPTVLNENNPLPANEPHPVEDEDIIEVGDARLEFRLEEPEISHGTEEADEEKKRRGEKYTAKTALAGGDDWRKKLHKALKQHNGQIDKVAEELEMSPSALEQMIEQMGMGRLVKD